MKPDPVTQADEYIRVMRDEMRQLDRETREQRIERYWNVYLEIETLRDKLPWRELFNNVGKYDVDDCRSMTWPELGPHEDDCADAVAFGSQNIDHIDPHTDALFDYVAATYWHRPERIISYLLDENNDLHRSARLFRWATFFFVISATCGFAVAYLAITR